MMNKYFIVLKTLFFQNFSFSKKNNKKQFSALAILGLFFVLFAGISILYNYIFFSALKELDLVKQYPIVVSGVVIFTTFLTSMFRAKNVLFSSLDHNLLIPLPIKQRTIIASKITLFYLEELFYSILIFGPCIVFYSTESIVFIIYGLLLLLILPFIVILLSTFLGFIVTLITNRFSIAKLISSIIYVLLFVGFMSVVMYLSYSNTGMDNSFQYIETLKKVCPILYWIEYGFVDYNVLYLLLVLIISFVSFVVLTLIYSYKYSDFYEMLSVAYSNRKYRKEDIKTNKPLITLIKKDFKNILSSPMLLINCIVGGIMSIILIVIFFASLSNYNLSEEQMNVIKAMYPLLCLVISMFGSMSSLTCVGISYEKNSFYIIKTLPIKTSTYLLSKIVINQILNGVLIFICSIIASVVAKLDILDVIFTIIFPQCYIFVLSMFGLILNLIFPKIHWENYNQLKNSYSMLIYTFSSMIFGAMLIFLNFMLISSIDKIFFYILNILLVIILFVLFFIILKKKAVKWLINIE